MTYSIFHKLTALFFFVDLIFIFLKNSKTQLIHMKLYILFECYKNQKNNVLN